MDESDGEVEMNWVDFLTNDVDDVLSYDESDYTPDDEEEVIPNALGRHVLYELEEESENEEMDESVGSEHEMDTSDEEFQIATQRVREYRAEVEKEGEGQLSEYEDSDGEIFILSENEEDDNARMKRRRSNMSIGVKTDYKNLEWKVGLRFPSIGLFKEAVRRYGIYNGFSLKFGKSDKRRGRVGVVCKQGCAFKLYASWHSKEGCVLVKTVYKEHECVRDMQRNRQLTSRWLAKEYLPRFKDNPQWPADQMVNSVKRRYGVIIKTWIAYKAKKMACMMLHGSVKGHYNKVGRFIEELKRSNDRSTFELLTIPSSPPIFQRFFVCFEGLKNGFVTGCRRFICLDGCFLKTFMGGILLAAVGRDGNNQMFPVCWAVVEGENRDSWEWFLNKLKSELNGTDGEGWTFMSDQQKGLLAASSSVFPKCYHRNCARHIYANWHKVHKGDELKMVFWRAVRAYNEADFEEAMVELRSLSSRAADDFLRQNPSVFCRAFFTNVSKCDVVVNNMAETFNGYILKARGKHLIDMLETIMTQLMERMVAKQGLMEGQHIDAICPRVKLKLEEEKVRAWELSVSPSTLTVFKVTEFVDSLKVDIHNQSCTCRKWDLTGIPCRHAIACFSFMKVRSENYVHVHYKKEAYLRAYEGHISPCVSERFWPKKNFPLDPPPIKVQPGRPKKNRRKDPHEDPKRPGKLTKHGMQMKCSLCKSNAHNKRKCPQKSDLPPPTEKRARGRPVKSPILQNVRRDVVSSGGESTNGRVRGRGRCLPARGRGVAARGVGISYMEGGGVLYRSSASRQPMVFGQAHVEPSQAHGLATFSNTSQEVQHPEHVFGSQRSRGH